jgi:hypothetical protein
MNASVVEIIIKNIKDFSVIKFVLVEEEWPIKY